MPPWPIAQRIAPWGTRQSSQRCVVDLASADADRVFDGRDKDFSVADASHTGRPSDGFDHLVGLIGSYNNLDLYFRHEEHRVLGATINLGMTALPAESLHVGDRHALHTESAQGFTHFLELEGLYDGGYEFHELL